MPAECSEVYQSLHITIESHFLDIIQIHLPDHLRKPFFDQNKTEMQKSEKPQGKNMIAQIQDFPSIFSIVVSVQQGKMISLL